MFVAAYLLVMAEEFTHLRWAPAIAAGYAASIMMHFRVNESCF